MKIFANVSLRKPRGLEAYGQIDLSFSPKDVKSYKIAVNEGAVIIKGDDLTMELSSFPNVSKLETPQQRAMAGIFAELAFGPLQAIYEKTSPTPLRPYTLPNEIGTRPVYAIGSVKVIETTTELESQELTVLMGRLPEKWELEYMEEKTRPVSFWQLRR